MQCKYKIRRRRVDKQTCLIRLSSDTPHTPDCVLMCCALSKKEAADLVCGTYMQIRKTDLR